MLTTLLIALQQDRRRPPQPEYKEYSTAQQIDEKWMDANLIGRKCFFCGCSDAQIVMETYIGQPKCKWCAEFDNICYHLKMNGVRRFEKGRK